MGLKSGSRDAGLDDSSDDGTATDEVERSGAETARESATAADTPAAETGDSDGEESKTGADTAITRPTMESIPYKLRREKVNEGREQVPYFLRAEVIDGEDELRDELEAILGEDVYKSDYREAAMVVAQRHPELVAEVLREWGYDLETA